MLDIGKVTERYLRCTDICIEAYAQAHATASINTLRAIELYHASHQTFQVLCDRQEARLYNASEGAEREACAQSWVNAHLERKIFLRIELLLVTVREQAAIATATSGSEPSQRSNAVYTVSYAAHAAFTLLRAVCRMAGIAWANGSSTASLEAATAMAQPAFISAVADAVRGICAIEALAVSGATVRQPADPEYGTTDALPRLSSTHRAAVAAGVCEHMSTMSVLVMYHVDYAMACDEGKPAPPMPSKLTRLVKALAQSQLLGAAAAAVVDSRPATAREATDLGGICIPVHHAALAAAKVLASLTAARRRLAASVRPEGRRLAVVLLRATRHVAVRRLQVALLDQLAAHAGMGAKLEGEMEEEVEGRGQGQEGSAQQQGRQGHVEGWEGCSGAWWLPQEETREGLVVGLSGYDWTAGWLENCHGVVILTTLAEWSQAAEQTNGHQQLAAEAGLPAGPPPLLAARLAARAAEALCRLFRGQGLGGAYSPAPEWQFAKAPALVLELVTKTHMADALPVATTQSCLPYWLEAVGWTAALLSDATAAAVGRLPATPRNAYRPHSNIDRALVTEGSQGAMLAALHGTMNAFATKQKYGFKSLPAAAQDDVRRRLFRCGLAASLDHTLRLAYSAQDGGQTDVAGPLQGATCEAVQMIETGLACLLVPTATTAAGNFGAAGDVGAAADLGSASSAIPEGAYGGCGGARHQLGLLYTLCKRAAMLTVALEQLPSPPVLVDLVTAAAASTATQSAKATGTEGGGEQQPLYTLCEQTAVPAHAGARADLCPPLGQGSAGTGAAAQEDGQCRQRLLCTAAEVVAALTVTSERLERELQARGGGAAGAAWQGEVQAGGGAAGKAAAAAAAAAGVQEARQALAMADRVASNLAAPLSWHLAAEVAAPVAEGGPDQQLFNVLRFATISIRKLLYRMVPRRCDALLLPPAHVLACQPHRLLAAACALEAARPPDRRELLRLGGDIANVVILLASHKELSGRVRAWMVPQQLAESAATSSSSSCGCRSDGDSSSGGGGSGGGGGGTGSRSACDAGGSGSRDGSKCSSSSDAGGSGSRSGSSSTCDTSCAVDVSAGCLAAPLQSAMRRALHYAPLYAVHALALVRIAAGGLGPKPGAPCSPGGGDLEGQADGGYQQYAEAVVGIMWESQKDPTALDTKAPLLPDGSRAADLLGAERDTGCNLPPPSAPLGALPPPLVLVPGRDRALLRMCGNPRCGNFGCEGEWALPLKLCGGCRVVRYCGADCQRVHWRGAHGAECKMLRAGMED